jgi:alpha-glucosidase
VTAPVAPRHVFVYGTLRPGHARWPILAPFAESDGWDDEVDGQLFDTGRGYPAARFDGTTGTIRGRTVPLRDESLAECLELIDEVEDTVLGLYRRIPVRTRAGVDAWAYEYGTGLDLSPIESGDWDDHRRPWWRDSVVYQIYPRSFADANGDGVGDLAGITQHVDDLAELGVDAVWLSPIFVSPMKDFGYDVADYCAIDPLFGTDADLDALVDGLHARGMRLLLDWVPNHTSDRHPWFLESRSSRQSPRRDWYVWRDPAPGGGPPNNWISAFKGVPAWTLDEVTGQYYLHVFLAEQPDLNWSNRDVEAAMHDTLRHWLDRGVDGFRADVVHLIGKGVELRDLPTGREHLPVISIDEPYTHELLRRIRDVLDEYPHQPMMVGEVYLLRPGQAVTYLGDGGELNELHLAFDFRPVHTEWVAARFQRVIDAVQGEFAEPAWPTWVLSNHDQPRHRTRFGSEARARAAAVLSLTVRGTPFLYAGEELGLEDAAVPPERVVDPDGRDGCRAPIPWEADAPFGWGEPTWLPFPPDAGARSYAAQRDDPSSTLHLYRTLLHLRRTHDVLRIGAMTMLDLGDHVIAYRRGDGEDALVVAVNFADSPVTIAEPGELGTLLVSTVAGRPPGEPFDGTLDGSEAVVIAA